MDYYIFNELSIPFSTSFEAKIGLETFIRTCAQVHELGLCTLRLPESIGKHLYSLQIAPNYLISQWLHESEVEEDLKDRFRTIATDSPLITETEPIAKESSSCSVFEIMLGNEIKTAEGLSAAYLLETLCLSFASHSIWNSEEITNVTHWYINEDDSEITETIAVKHASQPEHIAKHKTWFEHKRRASLQKRKALWEKRQDFFPDLILCGEVEKQLTNVGVHSKFFDQIIERLKRLNQYAKEWTDDAYSDNKVKQYGLNVSGESSSTLNNRRCKEQRKFKLPNGDRKLFEKHIKTGDLRFHFYPDNETRKVYVGYIGKHLRTDGNK